MSRNKLIISRVNSDLSEGEIVESELEDSDTNAKTEISSPSEQVRFDKKLLDYEYEDYEIRPLPKPQKPKSHSLVTFKRQMDPWQKNNVTALQPQNKNMKKFRDLHKQQEDNIRDRTAPNQPFAADCDFRGSTNTVINNNFYMDGNNPRAPHYQRAQLVNQSDKMCNQDNQVVEVIDLVDDDSSDDRQKKRTSRWSNKEEGKGQEKSKEEKEMESERELDRQKKGLPPISKNCLSICSTTLWVGRLAKNVRQADLLNTFGEIGDVVSIELIPPRSCAFVVMLRRQDAAKCLQKLKKHRFYGKEITLAWAPGKGVQDNHLKCYWNVTVGASYIPYSVLKEEGLDINMVENGSIIDEDTKPDWFNKQVEIMGKNTAPAELPNFIPPAGAPTSQPSLMPGTRMLPLPPMMPLVNPLQLNNRLMGMVAPPGIIPNIPNLAGMPNMRNMNIPLGIPLQNVAGSPMMGNPLVRLESVIPGAKPHFVGPPSIMPPLPPVTHESSLHNLGGPLMNMTQPFGMEPRPPPPHKDIMNVEMENVDKSVDKPLQFNEPSSTGDDDRDRRNRNRDQDRDNKHTNRDRSRERHSRDRDRDRDRRFNSRDDRVLSPRRDRDRQDDRFRDHINYRDGSDNRDRRDNNDRNSQWSDRDRVRDDNRDKRDNSDRNSQWSDRDRVRDNDRDDNRREVGTNVNDRLREIAGMRGFEDPRDRRLRDRDENLRFVAPRSNGRPEDEGEEIVQNVVGKTTEAVPPFIGFDGPRGISDGPRGMSDGPRGMSDGPPRGTNEFPPHTQRMRTSPTPPAISRSTSSIQNGVTNASNPHVTFQLLNNEFTELRNLVNMDGMLEAVRDLNEQLRRANSDYDKFTTFYHFTASLGKYQV